MLMKTKKGRIVRVENGSYTYLCSGLSFKLGLENVELAGSFKLSELLPADKLTKYLFDIEHDMSYDTERKGESNE
jgi:hypothetical protein